MKSMYLIAGLALLCSCGKKPIATSSKSCLDDKIVVYNKESHCGDASVSEYLFREKTVYVFEPGTCGADMASEVVTADCKTLGYLGGYAGNTKINGESFSNAEFVRVVWKKK